MSIGEIGNFYRGSGLESTMSPTDFRRMVTMKEPEFQEKFMKDIHDENALGIEDKTMKAWQDLNTHLKTMSELVSKSLYQAFEALIPGLTRFSQGLTNAFTVIMDSPFMKRMIRGSGKILNRLGEIVDSETSTKEKVESAAGLGKSLTDEFLGAHWKVAEWLWKKGIDNGMGVQVRGAPWGGVPGAIPDTKSGWDRIGDSIARWIGVGTGTGTNVGNAGVGGGGGGAAARALGRIYSGSSTANIPNDFNFATQGWNSEQMASARAIAGAEANWNPKEGGTGYLSMGKVTPSGDQAYGLYQVMGANIPGWTEKHLKRRMTPTEFLNDPAAQDKVFQEEFGGYLRQYGNLRDAVSMWKSGKPWELGQNLSDPTAGDNVRQYWDKVRGLYNQQPNVTKLEVTVLNKSGNNIVVNTAVGANNTGSYNIPA
jgi:hypothetical protein